MDLGNETDETELDYEEELQFSTDENKSTQETFMGNRKNQNESSLCCDNDQYLQINYLEEDENLSNVPSGIAAENINPSQTEVNSGVLCEEKETIINQRKGQFMTNSKVNRSGYNVRHNLKSKPLSHFRQPFRKIKDRTWAFTIDRLPNSTLLNTPIPFASPLSQRPNNQNSVHFLNTQKVQQFQSGALPALNKKFQELQQFSSQSLDFSQNRQDLFRNGNEQSHISDSSISLKYSSPPNNRPCRNLASGDIDYKSNSKVTKSQRDTIWNLPPVNTKKDFIDNSVCSESPMYKKNYINKEINSRKGGYSFSNDSEKELERLKRAARLIRFGNENSFQKSKTESKTYHENLFFEDEYFRKMEEQKHKRQKIFELKEQQRHKPEDGDKLMKFNTSENTLLKKINPFYVKSGVTRILDTKIKQEVKSSDEEETDNLNRKEGLHIIKCDFDSNVKFTRTISKTYEEMNLSKCLEQEATNTEETSTSVQPKVEDQSSGCIVKVLNLPQVTTSDVLALCSPVGKPLEVKLNVLKESAVIIKFANPIFASNFYGLYHGVKLNSNFLNIVII